MLKTYVAVILDKSGSMSGIRAEAINHFNEQLQVLKEESNSTAQVAKNLLKGQTPGNMETKVSFITFNDNVDVQVFDQDVNTLNEITEADYAPGGMTAMYDAIGFAIDKFVDDIPDINDPEVAVLFSIITDGQENSSKDYTREQVKSKIDDLQATGRWTFTFLGANQDVMETAVENLAMSVGNTMSFANTGAGMLAMSQAHTTGLKNYYSTRRMGGMSVSAFYSEVDDQTANASPDKDILDKLQASKIEIVGKEPKKGTITLGGDANGAKIDKLPNVDIKWKSTYDKGTKKKKAGGKQKSATG